MSACVGREQQEAEQCTEKYYGLPGTVSVRLMYWLFDVLKNQHELVVAAKAALDSSEHVKKTERAFVGISHYSDEADPGNPGFNPTNKKVRIQVRNMGQTPARVVGVKLGYLIIGKDDRLPAQPPFDQMTDQDAAQAFLPAGDNFSVRRGFDDMPPLEWGAVTRGDKTLYVLGLVEYVDVFDVWHRAGYARRYAHGRPKNNLTFVSGDAYSYDIVIQPGERFTGQAPQK